MGNLGYPAQASFVRKGQAMTRATVRLTRYQTRKNGKTYDYWLLRWHDGSGNRRSKNIGRAGDNGLSRRQAELERARQEEKVNASRAVRDAIEIPTLRQFLDRYYVVRKPEVRPGSLDIYRRTGKYMMEFFGKDCRLDAITRSRARDFKAALANDQLSTRFELATCTVNQHIRNARKMFALAAEDDYVMTNPFDRLASPTPPPKAWHEVTDDEFGKLQAVARSDWQMLMALGFLAALRRGEAFNLRWEQVDWERHRLTVIANEEWQPKDKDCRTVPIVPTLYTMLRQAYEKSDKRGNVIPKDTINLNNVSRDFDVLCRHARVERWVKPIHTLRKTCLTRWSRQFPMNVVKEWAGHEDERTTMQYYLKVGDMEYDRAAGLLHLSTEAPRPQEPPNPQQQPPPPPAV